MTHAKHSGLALGSGDHHQVAKREGILGFIRGRPLHFSSLKSAGPSSTKQGLGHEAAAVVAEGRCRGDVATAACPHDGFALRAWSAAAARHWNQHGGLAPLAAAAAITETLKNARKTEQD